MDDNMPMIGEVMTRDADGFSMPQAAVNAGDVAPFMGATMIQTTNRQVTAQAVAVPRVLPAIMREIREYCAQFGDTYVYSWEVNNRREGRKDTIEGGTIKLAMMLLQVFGNASVDCDVSETKTHWIFKAWFTDYQKGTQVSRLFQQRRNQNSGMKDVDRQADMVFQLGQSKAERNVILNGLGSFAMFAIEESKRGMLARFESPEAKEQAWAFINRTLDRHEISEARLTAIVGRPRKDMTVRDLVKAYTIVRGVAEGLVSAEDAFPTEEAAGEIQQEKDDETKALKKREGRATKGKTEAAPKEEPKTDARPADPVDPPKEEVKAEAPAPSAKKIASAIEAYAEASSFDMIQEFRGEIAKAGLTNAPGVAEAYEAAMKRVKAANAAQAAAAPAEGAKAEPKVDEADIINRLEEMFDGLDTDADIGEANRKAAGFTGNLSAAGKDQFASILSAAYARAEAKAQPTKPAEQPALRRPVLFSDED